MNIFYYKSIICTFICILTEGGTGASSFPEVYPDYVLETENRDNLSEPTFSSRPRLVFHRPGDAGSYPRSRSSDKLPLVVELDLASDFGSADDDENANATMDSRYLRQFGDTEKDYKSFENGNINCPPGDSARVTIDSGFPVSQTQSTENDSLTDYHCHIPKPQKDRIARNQLIIVTVLCAIFMVAEVVGRSAYSKQFFVCRLFITFESTMKIPVCF